MLFSWYVKVFALVLAAKLWEQAKGNRHHLSHKHSNQGHERRNMIGNTHGYYSRSNGLHYKGDNSPYGSLTRKFRTGWRIPGLPQLLGTRVRSFALMGTPLTGSKMFHDPPPQGRQGAFSINEEEVKGAGTYQVNDNSVDVEMKLKITPKGGMPRPRPAPVPAPIPAPVPAPVVPTFCLVPCSSAQAQTAPQAPVPAPALCPVQCPAPASGGQAPVGPGGSPNTTPGAGGQAPVSPSGQPNTGGQTPNAGGQTPGTPTGKPPAPGSGGNKTPAPGQTSVAPSGTNAKPQASKPTAGPGKTTAAPGGGSKTPTSAPGGGGSTTPSPNAETTPGPAKNYEEEVLNAHNMYRKRHNAPPMKLNPSMSSSAAEWAKYMGENKKFEHSPGEKRDNNGENIAEWCDSKPENGSQVSFRWYNEVCDPGYGFNSNDMDWGAGHFTQMVWINSTELGVGYYDRKRPDGFVCRTVVARYKPAGNGGGRFLEMVKKGSFDKSKHCKSKGRRSGLLRGVNKDTYSGIRRTEVRHAKHKHSHKYI